MTYDRFFKWKVLTYHERLKRIVEGEFPNPVVWHIYPTHTCNNRCYFCIMESLKSQQVSMDWSLMLKVVKTIEEKADSEFPIQLVHVTGGGEPLCHTHASRFLEKLGKAPVKVALTTNGFYLRPVMAQWVDHLRVSLNAATPETYSKVAGVTEDNFDKVLDKVEMLLDRATGRCTVGLAFLILPENAHEIEAFCGLASDIGADFVHIRPAYYPLADPYIYHLSGKSDIEALREKYPDLGIHITTEKFEGYWTERAFSRCRATPLQAVLDATGEFMVCQDVFIKWGNLYDKAFDEIWGSDGHKAAIQQANANLHLCPRCVETTHNQILENIYVRGRVPLELI